jgi:probable rRNA maturation factor
MNDPDDSTLTKPATESSADVEPPERLSVVVLREAGDWSAFPAAECAIETAATALASHTRFRSVAGAEAAVVLGDDALVRDLNKAYRSKDQPTNVLSFPFKAPPGAAPDGFLGDVVLAAETVAREAVERGIAPAHHLQHLVVHGLLHLLGFDHQTELEAGVMERLESEILGGLGVADPHAPVGTI